jgi:hypothetical protein
MIFLTESVLTDRQTNWVKLWDIFNWKMFLQTKSQSKLIFLTKSVPTDKHSFKNNLIFFMEKMFLLIKFQNKLTL